MRDLHLVSLGIGTWRYDLHVTGLKINLIGPNIVAAHFGVDALMCEAGWWPQPWLLRRPSSIGVTDANTGL